MAFPKLSDSRLHTQSLLRMNRGLKKHVEDVIFIYLFSLHQLARLYQMNPLKSHFEGHMTTVEREHIQEIMLHWIKH